MNSEKIPYPTTTDPWKHEGVKHTLLDTLDLRIDKVFCSFGHSSIHLHRNWQNSFYVNGGELHIEHQDPVTKQWYVVVLGEGEIFHIPVNVKHRIKFIQYACIDEIYVRSLGAATTKLDIKRFERGNIIWKHDKQVKVWI